MSNDVGEMLIAKMNAPPPPPLEVTRSFLRAYFGDALNFEEVRQQVERSVTINPRATQESLAALKAVLADTQMEAGLLAEMVAWDANLALDDPSDEGAKRWLGEVAAMLREVLSKEQATQSKM